MLLVLGLSACERPFVEISTPRIKVVEPDLSTVFSNPRIAISVEASSFRDVKEVTLNGTPMTFDPERNRWNISLELTNGLNTLFLEASDVDDVGGVDTAYAVYMPHRFIQTPFPPPLPAPRGGHTTTTLFDGSLLVAGGASRVNGPAHGDAFILPPNRGSFRFLEDTLRVARTGHTATLLPDGRVLMLGGSRTDDVRDIADLIETVEIFDPSTMTFSVLPFEGQPIRRTLHTAVLRNTVSGVFIQLYGGRGDIRYGAEPRLGTRRDLRTFELVNDTLFARNTLLSAPDLEAAISGHTETEVEPNRFLIFGSFFDEQFADEASFRVEYTSPADLVVTDAPPLLTPRTRHAAGTLSDRFVVIFGGRQSFPDLINQIELFSDQAGLFFKMPSNYAPIKRYGHTATNLSANRILLLGGFASDGNSLTTAELFDASL